MTFSAYLYVQSMFIWICVLSNIWKKCADDVDLLQSWRSFPFGHINAHLLRLREQLRTYMFMDVRQIKVQCKKGIKNIIWDTQKWIFKHILSSLSFFQGTLRARELGAVAYVECSSRMCVNSVRDVFHITTLASVRRPTPGLKRSSSRRTLKRISHQPLLPINSHTTPLEPSPTLRKDRAKSCTIM